MQTRILGTTGSPPQPQCARHAFAASRRPHDHRGKRLRGSVRQRAAQQRQVRVCGSAQR